MATSMEQRFQIIFIFHDDIEIGEERTFPFIRAVLRGGFSVIPMPSTFQRFEVCEWTDG